MTVHNTITALVLTAGYSSRMKRFKPLLPMGQTTTLERCITLFRGAGVQDVRVVIGHRADELKPLLDRMAVRWVENHHFDEGMYSSIQAGIEDLAPFIKGFFLLPVDIPLVRTTTVRDLLAARDSRDSEVWYPTFRGKRGHPPLITSAFRPAMLAWHGEGGLRAFFNEQRPRTVDVPVADEHVLRDMDTPEDYEDLLATLPDYAIPSVSECAAVLEEKLMVRGSVVAHATKVAQVALTLAQALNAAGSELNPKLVVAAALLHDLAKGSPDHAIVAERFVNELGYPEVARIIGSHMDFQAQPGQPVSPAEVLYFADKLVQDDRLVTLESRFRSRSRDFAHDPEVLEVMERRRASALLTQTRVERALGAPIEEILASCLVSVEKDPHENLSVQTRRNRA